MKPIQTALGIRSERWYHPEQPVRDPAYLRFIKGFPSVVSGKTWGIDPCHTGPHGIGQKASDLTAIPLTRAEHQEFDASPRAFATKHNLNIPALIEHFNRLWSERQSKEAA